MPNLSRLPPREREIARIVYAKGEASAVEIGRALPDPVSNAAVRTMLGRLQAKGVLRRHKEGNKFFYAPAATDEAARQAALAKLSRDYFDGSMAALAEAADALAEAERPRRLRLVGRR